MSVKDEDDTSGLSVVDAATEETAVGCDVSAAEDSYVEEAEEKINLLDALIDKEPEKETKDTFQNSTLIITTEEHLDVTTCEDVNQTEKLLVKPKPKTEDQGYFWVSNIGRHVKAADLKKLFSPMGKVATAKVLTNGKNYFGYVSVDSAETAAKCVKQLDNVQFDGKRIIVSKDRPDLREAKQAVMESKRKKENVPVVEVAKKVKSSEEDVQKDDVIVDLRKKVERLKADVGRYKWKVMEYQRRHEGMRKKCGNLEKELKEAEYKTRADRRRLNEEREQFEKTKKSELSRLEADRAVVDKELGEVRKLREHLKVKIDEMKVHPPHPKKNSKRRVSRSPVRIERSRSPRARSPPIRVGSRIGYRSEERTEKKRKRGDDPPRGRTPPPPPKLTNGAGKKRSDALSHRQYFDPVEKRPPPLQEYEYRHKASFVPPQEVARPPWPAPYSKDPRRLMTTPGGVQGYTVDPRYGAGYQFPSSSVAVPPRSYYPDFGKPYGHY